MTSAVQLHEALATAPDDKTRAKLIAEAIERREERYPHLPDLAIQAHLRKTELRLPEDSWVWAPSMGRCFPIAERTRPKQTSSDST
jgi:hypothetical protein